MVIYKYTNLINGKVYIGQSISPNKRYSRHLSEAKRGSTQVFHEAIRKYGIANFSYEIIDGANSGSELTYKEIHYIHKFNSISPNGYNLELGKKKHITSIKKQSISLKKSINLDQLKSNTELSKLKTCKKVLVINKTTGKRTVFESITACEILGVNSKCVSDILTGKRIYKPYKGYFFEFLDGNTVKRQKAYFGKSIVRISTDGTRKEYISIQSVEKDGFNKDVIFKYLKNKRPNYTSYIWEYC